MSGAGHHFQATRSAIFIRLFIRRPHPRVVQSFRYRVTEHIESLRDFDFNHTDPPDVLGSMEPKSHGLWVIVKSLGL